MLGLSAALHGLAMIVVPDNGSRSPPPARQEKIVSTFIMVKTGTPPPAKAPSIPAEKKIAEKQKPTEPRMELPPIQEALASKELREGAAAPEGEAGSGGTNEAAPEGEAVADRDYEALLAYIKDFINKNLIYPPMARRRNIQGLVVVQFEVESNGSLAAIMVDHSSGSSILDNAAVLLIKKMYPLNNAAIPRKLALKVNIDYKLTE
jgi:protein TonB